MSDQGAAHSPLRLPTRLGRDWPSGGYNGQNPGHELTPGIIAGHPRRLEAPVERVLRAC